MYKNINKKIYITNTIIILNFIIISGESKVGYSKPT